MSIADGYVCFSEASMYLFFSTMMTRMSPLVIQMWRLHHCILLSSGGMAKDKKCFCLAVMMDGKQRYLLFEGTVCIPNACSARAIYLVPITSTSGPRMSCLVLVVGHGNVFFYFQNDIGLIVMIVSLLNLDMSCKGNWYELYHCLPLQQLLTHKWSGALMLIKW